MMTQMTTPLTAASVNASDLLAFYKEILLDSDASNLELRRAVISGIQNIQSTEGRMALSEAYIALRDKLAKIENPEKLKPEARAAWIQDQDILVILNKILFVDGYFRSVKEKP
jgi:hypothetical protein